MSISDSDSFCTLESIMEKVKKEKDEKTLKILDPYIEKIRTLSNDIQKKDNLILYSNLKLNKIKYEYDELTKELMEEENALYETYITTIEKEQFYLSPTNLELKELAEKAREKKKNYDNIKDNYEYDRIYMNKKEEELEDRINGLPDDEQILYKILKEYILNDKDINKIKDDLELLSDNFNKNECNEIIKKSKPYIREIKDKMKNKKNEINNIKHEIKTNNDKKARKSINHLNYNNNVSIIKSNNDDNNTNTNSILDNSINNTNINNSFLCNTDLNRSISTNQNGVITNLNKTYYLRTNKPFFNSKNCINLINNTVNGTNHNSKGKSFSHLLNSDSSDKASNFNRNGRKDMYICKRLLKNYCNKFIKRNNDFMADLKLKEKKNQSMPKSLYEQRRIIRENSDDYVYINGNRYKQSLIGKATNTVNGVY